MSSKSGVCPGPAILVPRTLLVLSAVTALYFLLLPPMKVTSPGKSTAPLKLEHVFASGPATTVRRAYSEVDFPGASSMSTVDEARQPTAATLTKGSDATRSATERSCTRSPPYIYVCFSARSARLGNKMFQYAAGIGLAALHRRRLVLVMDRINVVKELAAMRRVFAVSNFPVVHERPAAAAILVESGWGKYDPRMHNGSAFVGDVAVRGSLQSWKYFSKAAAEVRREYALTPEVVGFTNSFFDASGLNETTLRIGVHIRRGDMVADHSPYSVAPLNYVVNAIERYRKKYGAEHKLSFVVATDDRPWAEMVFTNHMPTGLTVVYARFSPEMDLAVLSRCHHSIITGGTFGWWAAWLAGGEVVYYKDFIRPTSPLYKDYRESDYYPPSWTGLT